MPRWLKQSGIGLGIVVLFGAAGALAGSAVARDGVAQTPCESDQCGPSGSICVTATTRTSCDAIEGGQCRTLKCAKQVD